MSEQSMMAAAAAKGANHWRVLVERFQQSDARRASWQLANTLLPYAATWVAMVYAVQVSWLLALPLMVVAGGLLVRTFILFHDCGHGSFFASRRANRFWGTITGFLVFTPFEQWTQEHAIHHGTTGHLDRRGVGDVWTMTVEEYLSSPRSKRLLYRFVRNPIVLFVIAPLFLFLVIERRPRKGASAAERRSVWITNLAITAMVLGMGSLMGFGTYALLQVGAMAVASSAGVWLFYLQHQYEDAYWERGRNWNYEDAALKGSSFLRLPKVLQWFSGNIGFHHVHHLSPRIPNYHLERCHESDELFRSVKPMTLWSSFRSLRLRLWDESSRKLVSFRRIRHLPRGAGARQVA